MESTLTPSLVKSTNFGVVPVQGQSYNYYQVDGLIYAQPLYLSAVAMNTTNCPTANGPYNTVLVATENNSLYGLAYTYAKNGTSYQITWTQCWQAKLNKGPVNGSPVTGAAIAFTDLPNDPSTGYPCNNIVPASGITSTPVVDISVTPPIAYVVTANKMTVGGTPYWNYYIHAVRIDKGTEVTVQGGASSTYQIVLPAGQDAHMENQRPGIAMYKSSPTATTVNLYVGFGSYCDAGSYSGYVAGIQFSYSNSNGNTANTFSPIGSSATFIADTEAGSVQNHGGIWMGGSAPALDGNGNVYVSVGNGSFNGTSSRATTFGESVIKISSSTTSGLSVVDYYTLNNYSTLDTGSATVCTTYESPGITCPVSGTGTGDFALNLNNGGDIDLGSGGLTLIAPSTGVPNMCGTNQQLVAGGKEGVVYDICASTQTGNTQQTVMGGLDSCGYTPSSGCFNALGTTAGQTACTLNTPSTQVGYIAQCFQGVNAGQNQVVTTPPPTILPSPGIHGPQAFWNPGQVSLLTWNLLYVAGAGTRGGGNQPASLTKMEAYNMTTTTGVFSSTSDPDNIPITYPWPGTIPVVSWNSQDSANGPGNAVLWAIDAGGYGYWQSTAQKSGPASAAILYTYYALPQKNSKGNYQLTELSTSSTGPGAVKFTVPTVANGLAFVGGGVPGYAPGLKGGTNVNCTGVTLTGIGGTTQQCNGALYVYGQLQ
jgi:hypothetical protein